MCVCTCECVHERVCVHEYGCVSACAYVCECVCPFQRSLGTTLGEHRCYVVMTGHRTQITEESACHDEIQGLSPMLSWFEA